MSWFYAVRNEQKGPVPEEEFRALVALGVIRPDSLVWREGMPDWVPYSRSPAVDTPATGDGIVCAECQRGFRFEEVIRVGERYACRDCQPALLTRLKSELSSTGHIQTPAELELLDYQSSVLSCIGRGLSTLAQQCISIYAITFVFMAIFFGLSIFSINPIIDMLVAAVLGGPLVGGYWNYMVRKTRGDETGLANVFAGFGPPFPQLFLGYLVPSVLGGLCLAPGAFVMGIGAAMIAAGSPGGQPAAMAGGVIGLFGLIGFIYFTTCWFHVLALVIDKRMGFWSAMRLSRSMVTLHWWSNFMIGMIIAPFAFGPIIAFNVELVLQIVANPNVTDPMQLITGQLAVYGLVATGWTFCFAPWFFTSYGHRYNDMFGRLTRQDEY